MSGLVTVTAERDGNDEYLYVKLVGEALETLLMATTYHFLILYFAPFNGRPH